MKVSCHKRLPGDCDRIPLSDMNRNILNVFLNQFWDYYDALLTYKEAPSLEMATQLSLQFDRLFSTTTGYEAFDQRIRLTRTKKPNYCWF